MSPRRAAGFSLVETLCALLVLGVGVVGLTEGITTALRASKDSERHTVAAHLAAGRVELLRAEGTIIEGESEGDSGEDFPGYRWRETVSSSDLEGLFEVTVTIEDAASGEEVYELRTLLFDVPLTSIYDSAGTQEGGSSYGSEAYRRRGGGTR